MVGKMTMFDAKNKTFDVENFIFTALGRGGEHKSRGAPDVGGSRGSDEWVEWTNIQEF